MTVIQPLFARATIEYSPNEIRDKLGEKALQELEGSLARTRRCAWASPKTGDLLNQLPETAKIEFFPANPSMTLPTGSAPGTIQREQSSSHPARTLNVTLDSQPFVLKARLFTPEGVAIEPPLQQLREKRYGTPHGGHEAGSGPLEKIAVFVHRAVLSLAQQDQTKPFVSRER